MLLLGSIEPMTKVVVFAVEKSLALNKVNKHQPVEHHRGVPFVVFLDWDTGDELEERCVLFAELVVETFGNPFNVEGFTGATGHVHDRERFLLGKAEGNRLKFLDKRIAVLASMIGVFSASSRLSGLALNPLPDLSVSIFIQVQDQVLMNGLGNLPLDLATHGVIGDLPVGLRLAAKRYHALLLCDRGEIEHLAVYRNIQTVGVTVPAQLFNEKFTEIE